MQRDVGVLKSQTSPCPLLLMKVSLCARVLMDIALIAPRVLSHDFPDFIEILWQSFGCADTTGPGFGRMKTDIGENQFLSSAYTLHFRRLDPFLYLKDLCRLSIFQ